MSDPKQLSIIIANYNSGRLLEECLASLKDLASSVSCEICVVDNASSDGSSARIQEKYPELKVVKNHENYGFAKAVNQGLRETSAPYVMWLNPDAQYREGDFSKLFDRFEQDPDLGILGPKILNADESVQLSCRSFPSYLNYFFGRYSLLTRLFPNNRLSQKYLKSDWDHSKSCEVDWVSGACFVHRRSLLREIGWLDEGFFMYFEEVDFCRRAKQAGYKVRYEPACTFMHHIAGSAKEVPVKTLVIRHQSNWRYYTKYFQRNKVKDFVIASGLIARCFLQIIFSRMSFKRPSKKT